MTVVTDEGAGRRRKSIDELSVINSLHTELTPHYTVSTLNPRFSGQPAEGPAGHFVEGPTRSGFLSMGGFPRAHKRAKITVQDRDPPTALDHTSWGTGQAGRGRSHGDEAGPLRPRWP